jgi:anti-sigma factor RsiW
MFDFLRNWTKSAEEKQQEALNAYLDDALSAQERQQFEKLLADDADLRQEVEQRQALQTQMRQMPRRRVPRNFTLDPAVYGRPQRQPLFQLYPAMRVAAVLTAFFLILAVGSELFLVGQGGAQLESAPAQDIAMMEEEAVEESAAEIPLAAPVEAVVEVTRVVTEVVVEEGESVETIVEAEMAQEVPAEEMAEEEMAEAAEFAVEEEARPAAEEPEAAEPSEQSDDTATDAADATGGADLQLTATAPPSTPSPAPTLTASATIDATKSTVPRPETETVTGERAFPTEPPQLQDGDEMIAATAVPTRVASDREPISGLRWLQIGLGVLLIVLVTAVVYVRRQAF